MVGHLNRGRQFYFGDNATMWMTIWNLDGHPKLHHFLWKACTGSLAVKGRLVERHVASEGMCELCGAESESIIHTLVECPEIASVWEKSLFSSLLNEAPRSSFGECFAWLCLKMDREKILNCATIMWVAWAFRNSVGFNEPWCELQQGVEGYSRLVREYRMYAATVFRRQPVQTVPSSREWRPPAA
ncbi:hypothetical protein RDABS01_003492 [Bienertia sinuspersici]